VLCKVAGAEVAQVEPGRPPVVLSSSAAGSARCPRAPIGTRFVA